MKELFEMCVSGKVHVDNVFLDMVEGTMQSEFIILFWEMYCI